MKTTARFAPKTSRRPPAPLFLALALSALVAAPSLADISRSFDVGAGGSLWVEVEGASVQIDTGGDAVEVLVERRRGSDPIEKDFDVRLEQNGDRVEVEIEKRTRQWLGSDGLRLEIRVPQRFDLDVSTSGGSVSVRDLDGEVDISTSGGSVDLGHIDGPVDVSTSGGSITLKSSTVTADLSTSGGSITIGDVDGDITAKTSGGSVQVERAAGDVDISTSGGSIDLADIGGSVHASTSGGGVRVAFSRQPTADSEISTSGGSVVVSLADGLGFDLDARGSSGVTTDVPITVQGRIERTRVQGRINGGGPALVLRASGGRVVIED